MNQTEDLLQELIEQLENGEPVDDVAADLPAEEAEVIRLIAALKQAPAPAVDEALIAAQEAQLLTAVYTQYAATKPVTVAKPPLTAVLLAYLQQMWVTINNNRELSFGLAALFLIIAATWLFSSRSSDSATLANEQIISKPIASETNGVETIVTTDEIY